MYSTYAMIPMGHQLIISKFHVLLQDLLRQDTSKGWLSSIELTCIYKNSCSRRNFAVNLTRRMFNQDVIKRVRKKGKSRLNPVIMDYIKSTVFQL